MGSLTKIGSLNGNIYDTPIEIPNETSLWKPSKWVLRPQFPTTFISKRGFNSFSENSRVPKKILFPNHRCLSLSKREVLEQISRDG